MSNLSQDNGYPDQGFLLFSSLSLSKW